MVSASRDALTECKEIRKRVRTYRAGVDGCGVSAGRVASTGCAPHDDGSAAHNDGYAARDNGSTVADDGSTARDDRYAACDDRN